MLPGCPAKMREEPGRIRGWWPTEAQRVVALRLRVDTRTASRLSLPAMLTIPLTRLEREGSLEIRAEIPPEDPSWEGTELRFSSPLLVTGVASWMPGGGVLARLRLQGQLHQECRRCLEPVTVLVEERIDLLFSPEGVGEADEGVGEADRDDESRPLPEGSTELDLTEAIREETILSQSSLALCKPDCLGLCPRCGVNLNEESCQCSSEDRDPRWDALRALREERD